MAASFSKRELQVAVLIARGKTTKEIAVALKLTPATVSSYRKQLCRKLRVHSTAELVAMSVQFMAQARGSAVEDT